MTSCHIWHLPPCKLPLVTFPSLQESPFWNITPCDSFNHVTAPLDVWHRSAVYSSLLMTPYFMFHITNVTSQYSLGLPSLCVTSPTMWGFPQGGHPLCHLRRQSPFFDVWHTTNECTKAGCYDWTQEFAKKNIPKKKPRRKLEVLLTHPGAWLVTKWIHIGSYYLCKSHHRFDKHYSTICMQV